MPTERGIWKPVDYRYMREFGFLLTGRSVFVDDIRVRGVALSGVTSHHTIQPALHPPQQIQVIQRIKLCACLLRRISSEVTSPVILQLIINAGEPRCID